MYHSLARMSFIQETNAANKKLSNWRGEVVTIDQVHPHHGTRIMVDAGSFEDGITGWGLIIKESQGSIISKACKSEENRFDPALTEALGVR